MLEAKSDGRLHSSDYTPDEGRASSEQARNLSPVQQNPKEHSPFASDPMTPPNRFSQVVRLKEYLQLNIKVLQDQIDWNLEKIQADEL